MATTDLKFSIFARDQASPTFDKVSKSADRTHRTFGVLGKGVGATAKSLGVAAKAIAAVGAAAGVGIAIFAKGAIEEAREAEKVGKTTTAIIKSTGGAAKISAAQVGTLAEKLSVKAGVDDEVIQTGANLLLTFKNVRNEVGKGNAVFDRATQAAVDLSAAGFGSVDNASKMLGKALNDPLKGISALGRAGVTFTDGQKKQIKSLVESGKTLEAQKIILAEVESQVGGVAAAQASASDKAKVAWGNFKEAIGTQLLPIIDKVLEGFTKMLPSVEKVAGKLIAKIDPALKALGKVGKAVKVLFEVDPDASQGFAEIMDNILGNTGKLVPAFRVVGDVIRNGVNGVKAFFAAMKDGDVTSDGFVGIMEQIGVTVRQVFQAAGPIIKQTVGQLMELGRVAAPLVQKAFGIIGEVVSKVIKIVGPIISQIRGTLIGAFKEAGPQISSAMESIRSIVIGVLAVLQVAWQRFGPTILAVVKVVFGTIFKVIGGVLKAVAGVVKLVMAVIKGDWSGAWDAIKQIFSGVWQAIKGLLSGALNVIKAVLGGALSFLKSLWDRVWGGVRDGIGKVFSAIGRTVSNWARTAPTALLNAGKNLINGLKNGITSVLSTIYEWMRKNVSAKVVGFFAKAGEWLYEKGKQLLGGLKSGMLNLLAKPGQWFKSIGDKIISGVKGFFGIKSPSTVFAGFGRQLIAGLGKGMLGANPAALAKKAFGSMNNALKSLVGKGLINVTDQPISSKIMEILGWFQDLGGGGGGGSSTSRANMAIAQRLMGGFGFGGGQWGALRALWHGESGWNHHALNKSSGAYGIPQSLPASKMASAGSDWRTNPATQIRWGLQYIKDRYGSPGNAYSAWQRRSPHWYGKGGIIDELVLGIGMRTGKKYGFGESGRETVIPGVVKPGGSGAAQVHVHFHGPVGSQQQLENWLVAALQNIQRRGRAGTG